MIKKDGGKVKGGEMPGSDPPARPPARFCRK